MSISYPIWINVSGDNYKKDKSFGTRDYVAMDIKVGSSTRSTSNGPGIMDIARSVKHQASSFKRQAHQATSRKRQAPSPQAHAPSQKIQAP